MIICWCVQLGKCPTRFCWLRVDGLLTHPKGVRLNKYGNLPKSKLSGLKANPNVFAGSVDGASGFWQRKKYQPLTGK
ncbi:hypothetical protein BA171_01870 [Candidatus Hamiltonella defensa (Bemisia tabaci)]|uniref:Uncharacterized protein n=1 Tax=Candidatus Hamiltonella defensa (Bemisia tabaci) TaxID=672795 RepID=A0A249DWI1_9ENTR|nr:hypothetical protein BA171_01870 [Candidatus Hamiltonella defensa (Bemisia tabaci)]